MKEDESKDGLFKRIFRSKKTTGCSCCGNFVLEDIPDTIVINSKENPNPVENTTSNEDDCCRN